jgi:hypothetical protein
MNHDQAARQLLNEIAETEVPAGSLTLSARIRQQASELPLQQQPAPRIPHLRLARPALTALCLLLIFAVGLQLLPGQALTVSAQEALRRAEQATSFGLSGIRSLHGVLETVAPGSDTVVREEVWVDLPSSSLRRAIIWPATDQMEAEVQTDLTNGVDAWRWSTPLSEPATVLYDGISRINPDDVEEGLYIVPHPAQSLDTPDAPSAGLCAQPGDELALVGEATVLDRATLVIECRIGAAGVSPGTRLKLWIDKQLFVVLNYQHYDPTGELFIESRFTQFDVDAPIPAERFILTPPPNVPIKDERSGAGS